MIITTGTMDPAWFYAMAAISGIFIVGLFVARTIGIMNEGEGWIADLAILFFALFIAAEVYGLIIIAMVIFGWLYCAAAPGIIDYLEKAFPPRS